MKKGISKRKNAILLYFKRLFKYAELDVLVKAKLRFEQHDGHTALVAQSVYSF